MKSNEQEFIEAVLIIGARRANPDLIHDTALELIKQDIDNLSRRLKQMYSTSELRAELESVKAERDELKKQLSDTKSYLTGIGVLTGEDAKRFKKKHDESIKRIDDRKGIELPTIDLKDYNIKKL